MVKRRIEVEEETVIYLLKKCFCMKDLKQIHARVIQLGFEQNVFVVGKVIVFCAVAEHGDVNYAVSVFQKVENPDAFIWNTMIRGFGKATDPRRAFDFYKRMQERGLVADNFTFSFLLKVCGQLGSVLLGRQMHCSALKHGLDSHVFVRNTLVHMYGVFKDIERSRQLFEEIPSPELVSWNIMIDCHVSCGKFKEALDMFSRMLKFGIDPDEVTFVVTLSACSSLGALDFGRWVHSCIGNTGYGSIIEVSNSLIDMYAKCGALEEAYETFNGMKNKTTVTWNTMILGLASHGCVNEALVLFCKMLEQKLWAPDGITFLVVLHACSHGGMVDEGRRFFDVMNKEYHIQPTIKHYGCMVDILGRAGFVEESYRLISSMPMQCNAIVWRTLLAACRLHGNVELGEQIRKQLLELEPDHSSDYVLLANAYASAGQWNEVMRVRNSMQKRGFRNLNLVIALWAGIPLLNFVGRMRASGGELLPYTNTMVFSLPPNV
ncbi:unnamed protein product [Dovyalis caffra]|uniref:Pentatricopeptide repeat-containing protein n=1 Tax=Dovyalis caffra TaxID=77055 RepID=A0AAV1SGZ2_9ROSI|nr:unnamed protein product [Dovyalis caffra]